MSTAIAISGRIEEIVDNNIVNQKRGIERTSTTESPGGST